MSCFLRPDFHLVVTVVGKSALTIRYSLNLSFLLQAVFCSVILGVDLCAYSNTLVTLIYIFTKVTAVKWNWTRFTEQILIYKSRQYIYLQ